MDSGERIASECAARWNNFLFFGEAGSGKTELALNFALAIRRLGLKEVHFFDLDQTKPLFRSRDSFAKLELEGVHIHCMEQVLDAPLAVGGALESLEDEDCFTLLDIGGGSIGARMAGRLSRGTARSDSCSFLVVNTYRPWADTAEELYSGLAAIASAGRAEDCRIVANPNLGSETTADELEAGYEKLCEMLGGNESIEFVCARRALCPEGEERLGRPIFPLERYISYPGD